MNPWYLVLASALYNAVVAVSTTITLYFTIRNFNQQQARHAETIRQQQITHTENVKTTMLHHNSVMAADRQNATMQVILHCNARYADLYRIRQQIGEKRFEIKSKMEKYSNGYGPPASGSISGLDASFDREAAEKLQMELRDSYFRQYWSLKSDQIDYWVAGYVDPDTVLFWLLSTVDSIFKGTKIDEMSYRESWPKVVDDHRYVNPTFVRMIDEFMEIALEKESLTRMLKLYSLLMLVESNSHDFREQLKSGELRFSNMHYGYGDSQRLRIESELILYKRKFGDSLMKVPEE